MIHKEHRRCPECLDPSHLYGRSDSKWDADLGQWVLGDMEAEIECTECDWLGDINETEWKP